VDANAAMTQTAAMQWRRIMPTDHDRRDQPGSHLSPRSSVSCKG
jgi:hypothetical protein